MEKCPQCGYQENTTANPFNRVEPVEYVDESGKSFGILDDKGAKITIDNPRRVDLHGKVLIRKKDFMAKPTSTAELKQQNPGVEKAPLVAASK